MTAATKHEVVQGAVLGVLQGTPSFRSLAEADREHLARRMVQVGMLAADLVEQELSETPDVAEASPPLAAGLAAGGGDFGAATSAGTQTLRDAERAIDFPRFVTSLISGTFQAISNSNIQQLESLSSLLDNVTASAEEFSADNVNDAAAIAWAVQKFPFLTAVDGELVLRDDAVLADQTARLKSALGASDAEVARIDQGDIAGSLLPLVRRKLGRDRQTLLATIVQLGLQRIVVDEGRLHASMDLRVDARSIAEQSRRDREEFGISTGASASFGVGAWGASARMDMNFSKVHAEDQYSRNEVGLRAGLRSSVDLAFRTEQVPLDRMAGPAARAKIDASGRVPVSVADGSGSVLQDQPRVDLKPLEPTFKPPPPPVAPTPPDLVSGEKAKPKATEAKPDAGKGTGGGKTAGVEANAAKKLGGRASSDGRIAPGEPHRLGRKAGTAPPVGEELSARGDAAGDPGGWFPERTMGHRASERFDVWYDVPLVGQQSGMSCWAAAAAMIVAWRECIDVHPEDIAKGAGRWAEYREGLLPDDVDTMARAFGLVVEAPRTYDVAALRDTLMRCGPLWMGEASPGLHVVVLSGMTGDGTLDATWLRICDPWPRGRGERYVLGFRDLLASFHAVESVSGVQARLLHCAEGTPLERGAGSVMRWERRESSWESSSHSS